MQIKWHGITLNGYFHPSSVPAAKATGKEITFMRGHGRLFMPRGGRRSSDSSRVIGFSEEGNAPNRLVAATETALITVIESIESARVSYNPLGTLTFMDGLWNNRSYSNMLLSEFSPMDPISISGTESGYKWHSIFSATFEEFPL